MFRRAERDSTPACEIYEGEDRSAAVCTHARCTDQREGDRVIGTIDSELMPDMQAEPRSMRSIGLRSIRRGVNRRI